MTLSGAITGGWVIYGGLFGGLLGGIIYCRWRKVDFWEYMDIAVPAVAFAQGCGRIGCFFAGCCYGLETDSSWFYLEFSNSAFAPNHVHLIPTELIMSAGDFLLFFVLLWYEKKVQKREGEVLGLYLTLYSIGRFIVEFFRGDTIRGQIGILSTSQFIGIFAAVAGLIILIVQRHNGRLVEELLAAKLQRTRQRLLRRQRRTQMLPEKQTQQLRQKKQITTNRRMCNRRNEQVMTGRRTCAGRIKNE